jgi:asparagine synthase (glutamine-hydrolysing)
MKALCEKYLLRRCADGLIPASIRARTKQPYRAPDGRCFLDPSLDYIADLLSPEGIRRYSIFDPGAVGRLLTKFRAGKAIGARDNMALVGVVSTQVLAHQFLHSTPRMISHADSRRTETVRH